MTTTTKSPPPGLNEDGLPGPAYRDRIVGMDKVPPEELLANPFNFRIHPRFQQEALDGVLNEVGWVQNVVVNKATGHVVDGHLRVSLALRREEPFVPVVYVDLTEAEERLVLAALDPVAGLAVTDGAKLRELLDLTQTNSAAVQSLLDHVAKAAPTDSAGGTSLSSSDDDDEGPDEDAGQIFQFREDVIFSSGNVWGLPDLRADMLARIEDMPTEVWDGIEEVEPDSNPRKLFLYGTSKPPVTCKGHVVGFYVDDYRFEVIWNDAVKILEKFQRMGWGACVMPDFSLWGSDPLAIQMYNLYRSRWVARYWQEAGIRVIPNITFSDERTFEFAVAGIPKRPPCVAVQCRTDNKTPKGRKLFLDGVREYVAHVEPEWVILYGGKKHREWLEQGLPSGPQYCYLPSWTHIRQERGIVRSMR
jgi:hypothetical protein